MIKISPTALNQFLSGCPGRLAWYQSHKLKEMYLPGPLRFGIEVHKLAETGDFPDDIFEYADSGGNVLAAEVARKMVKVLEKQGYEFLRYSV